MQNRRLAAIMATDMVGYTAIMGANEDRALGLVARTHDLVKPIVAKHKGEWLEDAADRTLTAFPSAFDAVECALEVQRALVDDADIDLRMGIDMGEIIVSERHVYGDTVNVVSFIERLADPGGLVISASVYEAVRGKIDLNVVDLGDKLIRNSGHSIRLYALSGGRPQAKLVGVLSSLVARRVPHIAGAYLAAGWAVVEVIEWLSAQQLLDPRWVYATFVGLVALVPSVLMVTYLHGAHGADRLQKVEIIAVPINVVIAIALLAFTFRTSELPAPSGEIDPASVAVLPFENMSDDAENEYFSRGLSEELINALASIPGLYVASRTSSFLFDGAREDPRDIARKLRVATILEGSVRKSGDTIRITAQLIDGENNYHLWARTYDRDFSDIFLIQEDIAREVAGELVGVLQPGTISIFAEARADTISAYDYYLRGLAYLRDPPTGRSLDAAGDLFQRAIGEDPNYAQAFAGLCEVALERYALTGSPALIDEARSHCETALGINPANSEARFALGELLRYTGEFEESARLFREILDEQATARAWVGLGNTNVAQGNFKAAEIAFGNAIEREPGNWKHRIALAEFYYWRGRFEEAVEVLNRVLELSPDNARAWLLIGASLNYLGNPEASLEATLKAIDISPTPGAYRDLGLSYFYAGEYRKAAEAYRQAVLMGPEDHWAWGSLASAYQHLGEQAASRDAYLQATELAEAVLARNDRDWVTLATLALYNARTGHLEEAEKKIEAALAGGRETDEVHFYDALIRLQLKQPDRALDALEKAIEAGFPALVIARDPDLLTLREDPRFKQLVADRQEAMQ